MFTGLIRAQGELTALRPRGEGVEVLVAGVPAAWRLDEGASLAVDGICLTVESFSAAGVQMYLSAETLACTTARTWAPGRSMHLEPALRAGDPLGGHMVSGHVDAVGILSAREPRGEDLVLTFTLPAALAPAVVPKGSIAVDGVSLTVNATDGATFAVNIIPHTQRATHLGRLAVGDAVNLEADMVAKQVAHLMAIYKGNEAA